MELQSQKIIKNKLRIASVTFLMFEIWCKIPGKAYFVPKGQLMHSLWPNLEFFQNSAWDIFHKFWTLGLLCLYIKFKKNLMNGRTRIGRYNSNIFMPKKSAIFRI